MKQTAAAGPVSAARTPVVVAAVGAAATSSSQVDPPRQVGPRSPIPRAPSRSRQAAGELRLTSRAMKLQPSAGYSLIVRTETSNAPGLLGLVIGAIGEEGGEVGAIDVVRAGGGSMVRDITVAARDAAHGEAIFNHV